MPKDKLKAFRLVEPDGGLPEIYSNHVALSTTRDDLRLAFGQIVPAEGQILSLIHICSKQPEPIPMC